LSDFCHGEWSALPTPTRNVTTIDPSPSSLRDASRTGDGRARPPAGFWYLLAATGISSVGDGLALVALPLLAASLTTNGALVAGVVAAQRLPWLLFSLPAGALADRGNARRLLCTADVARMVAVGVFGALVIVTGVAVPVLYVLAFALGSFEVLASAASQAVVPSLIRGDDARAQANGRLLAAQLTGEQFAGPALGGVVFAAAAAAPFLVDSASFAASAALLLFALPRPRRARVPVERPPLRADIRDGLRVFRDDAWLRLLAALVGAFAFTQAMVFGVLVLFGRDELGLTGGGYGVLLAVAAIGNVAGSLLAGRAHSRFRAVRTLVGAGLLAGVSYLALAATSSVPLAGAALAVEALAVAVGNVASVTMRQAVIPTGQLGRVGSTMRLVIFGAMPVGALVGGAIAELVSVRGAITAAGALQLVVVAAGTPRLGRAFPGGDGSEVAG
jgi:MFS family permease